MILKNNYVKLNERGKRKHPYYPPDNIYKVLDFYDVPGTHVTKLTCSCEQNPNPKSKKGLYYMVNTEVTKIDQKEKKLENLSAFDFINYPKSYCNEDMDAVFLKVNRCLNIINTYDIPEPLKNELEILNRNFGLDLERMLNMVGDIFNDNIKLSFLYYLHHKINDKIADWKKQTIRDNYKSYYYKFNILKSIFNTPKCNYDYLYNLFKDSKYLEKSFDDLMKNDIIKEIIESDGTSYLIVDKDFEEFLF